MAATIAVIGVAASVATTAVSIDQSNQNADKSRALMDTQNKQQQDLIDQQKQKEADAQKGLNDTQALSEARNAAIIKNATTKQGRTGTILTSPLSPLAGTKGVPSSGSAGSVGSMSGQGTGGGKTLLGM